MRIVKKVKPFFTDVRGEISQILPDETSITSALLITSKKGSIRANHYHKKDIHHVYLVKGKMQYTYKKITKKGSSKKSVIVKEGDVVTSPALTMHAMKFLEDTVFIALTTEPRKRRQYENDTVRIKLINE